MKNFARIVAIVCLSTSCTTAVARSWFLETYFKLTRNYTEIYAGENYQSISALRAARRQLWKEKISKRKKIAITHAMHDRVQPFFHQADDYIKLLAPDYYDFRSVWAPNVNDEFIEKNLDNFFATRPSFQQVMDYQECATDLRLIFTLRREALALAKNATDIIAATETTWSRGDSIRDTATLDFIRETLPIFKDHKPSLKDIEKFQRRISNIVLPAQELFEVVIAMKKLFLDSFYGEDLFTLLQLDCFVREDYSDMRAQLIADNLDQILGNLRTVGQFHTIEKFMRSDVDRLHVKKVGLAYVKNPQDFLIIMKPTTHNRAYRARIIDLMKRSLHEFSALKPSVKNLKDLRKLLTTIHANNADVVVLLSPFINDFHDDELVSLLRAFKFDCVREHNIDAIASSIRARDVRRIERFHVDYNFGLTLRNRLLPHVDAKNFIKLMRSERPEKKFNDALNAMIAGNLNFFRSLNPTIDDVLELKIVIGALKLPQEKLVGTKLKLIDTFWDSFSGLQHAEFISANDSWMIEEIKKLKHVDI